MKSYIFIGILGIICVISGFVTDSDSSRILGAIFLSASLVIVEVNNKIK